MRYNAFDHPMEKGARGLERKHNKDNKAGESEEIRDIASSEKYTGDGAADSDLPLTEVEELLIQRLSEGDPQSADPDEAAVRALPPRWEIRIQTEYDPVAEETKIFRSMAREVDDRYGKDE
jgi:hypothetical protein